MKKQEGGRQTYVFLAVMCLLVAVVFPGKKPGENRVPGTFG